MVSQIKVTGKLIFSNHSLFKGLVNRTITASIRSHSYIERFGIREGFGADVIFKSRGKRINLGIVKINKITGVKSFRILSDSILKKTGYSDINSLCRAIIRFFRYNLWLYPTEKLKYSLGEMDPCELADMLSAFYLIEFEWLDKSRSLLSLISSNEKSML